MNDSSFIGYMCPSNLCWGSWRFTGTCPLLQEPELSGAWGPKYDAGDGSYLELTNLLYIGESVLLTRNSDRKSQLIRHR